MSAISGQDLPDLKPTTRDATILSLLYSNYTQHNQFVDREKGAGQVSRRGVANLAGCIYQGGPICLQPFVGMSLASDTRILAYSLYFSPRTDFFGIATRYTPI